MPGLTIAQLLAFTPISYLVTVVYVTHDQEEALAVSDRIVVMHSATIVQDGTPRDLYERPANRFIADFIGNANLLPVMITRDHGELASVALGPLLLRLPHRDLPAGPAELAVRPQGIHIHARPAGAHEIAGRVRKAAYLGSHMEYEVTLDQVPGEIFVIDGEVAAPMPAGTVVAAAVAPGSATLVAFGRIGAA